MPDQFIAKSIDDQPDRDTMLGMSGLEFMQAILDGHITGPPIAGPIGYHLDQVGKGRVVFRGTPGFHATNPMGSVQGGWYAVLLDSCMGCAVMTMLPKGAMYTTLEYKINITRAVPVGTEVLAVGLVQHAGRSTGVANGELRGAEDGKLYATGSTTCIIMRPD